ncbi:MAG: class I SAM-dependent methyltransferase [Chlamydiales bacterium]|nr:class I SAM-dependent methyltransferase [Chlamydiales bacterium]
MKISSASFEYLDLSIRATKVQVTKEISLKRIPTSNGFGYIFLTFSPLTADFIENEAHPGANLIEIGSGFGNVPIEALKRQVRSYEAIDICEQHLKFLQARTLEAREKDNSINPEKLHLMHAKAPQELAKCRDFYDAILIDKTLHFFTPEEVEQFLIWAHEALTPQGHLYVLTISPYISSYAEKVLPEYMANQSSGARFPGYVPDATEHLAESSRSDANYRVPKTMLFFTLEDLCTLFKEHGFCVEKEYSVKLPTEQCPEWTNVPPDESSLVGLKVRKNVRSRL